MLIATRTIEKIKFKIYVTQTQTWSMTFSNQKNIGYKKTHVPPWSNWYFVLLIISVYSILFHILLYTAWVARCSDCIPLVKVLRSKPKQKLTHGCGISGQNSCKGCVDKLINCSVTIHNPNSNTATEAGNTLVWGEIIGRSNCIFRNTCACAFSTFLSCSWFKKLFNFNAFYDVSLWYIYQTQTRQLYTLFTWSTCTLVIYHESRTWMSLTWGRFIF